ncbi:MAG: CdaR family protein [Lachnospiraceae bacterium]
MARKILKVLTNNIGLKLISILLAFILWLVVVNIDNPKITLTFTAAAIIENSSVITDNDKVFEILDDSNMVTFSVTGQRSVVEGLSASDFKVVADMNKIDLELGFVPIDITPLRYASRVSIEKKTTNLKVVIEDLATEQFAISANVSGEPANGFAVGQVKAEPTTVTVAGPQSVIKRIGKVVATVNIDDATSDKTQSVVPVIYDGEGKVIDTTNLSVSPGAIEVVAEILETKEIPIHVETSGVPGDGYTYLEVKSAPMTIVVKGRRQDLKEIHDITIPAKDINIEGAKANVEKTVDIQLYLPKGIELYDQDFANIAITVIINKLATKEISISLNEIQTENIPEGLTPEFKQEEFKILLSGLSQEIENLTAADLQSWIDFDKTKEGSFQLELFVKLPEGVTQIGKIEVKGKLIKSDEEIPDDTDPNNDTN